MTFLVRCSYCEIYNEEIRDLLEYDPKHKLELKESKDHGIFIKNLSMHTVKTVQDIEDAMNQGNGHRITKKTNINEKSSRSHAIFTIYIESSEPVADRQVFRAGKLNLVDLAGSERQKKTGAAGERLKEAIEINLSLSALGNVISALVDGKVSHIPYRDSKLTRLLQDSLGGNTKTVMIAVVSPSNMNYDESLSTLRYASRAKFIQNKPTVNEDPKDALLKQYAEEIQRLKSLLEQQPQPLPQLQESIIQGGDLHDSHLQEKLKAQRAFRKQLKKQKLREKALIEERERQEKELLERNHHYNSLQEEVEALRNLVGKLQDQYEAAQQEIRDLTHEFEIDKENLLENVREIEHECDFLLKVVQGVMNPTELEKIRRKSRFDEVNNSWKVPVFVLQNQQTVFPKISKLHAKELLNSEIKTVVFQEETPQWRPSKGSERVFKTPRKRYETPAPDLHSISTNGIKRNAVSIERKQPRNKNFMKLEPLQAQTRIAKANFSSLL